MERNYSGDGELTVRHALFQMTSTSTATPATREQLHRPSYRMLISCYLTARGTVRISWFHVNASVLSHDSVDSAEAFFEVICKLVGSPFYFYKDTFDGVASAVRIVNEVQAVAVERGVEPRAAVAMLQRLGNVTGFERSGVAKDAVGHGVRVPALGV